MYRTADEEWTSAISRVLDEGLPVHPRAETARKTVEVVGMQTRVLMSRPVVTNPARKLGYKFQAAEAAWILSGQDDVATISRYSRDISKFSDDGVVFAGAYGPKIVSQVSYVADTLRRDPLSRQAVMSIWRETPGPSKDVPCTLSLQFLLRQGLIHCNATMRSSDLWLGWPYDVFNFSCVSTMVALMLESRPKLGGLTLTAGSQHIYENNLDACVDAKPVDFHEVVMGPWLETDMFRDPESFLRFLWSAAEHGGSKRALDDRLKAASENSDE